MFIINYFLIINNYLLFAYSCYIGHYWFIHPANRRDFEKGDFRRRRAQRKVRRHLGLGMLDSRLNEDDQDSEDEEIKKQFFSQFNHLQQLNLHNLHNFQNNLYHLNNLNSLNNLSSPSALAAQNQLNCPPIDGINSSDEYLNYLAFFKRSWLNGLSPASLTTNPAFSNTAGLEIKPPPSSLQYQVDNAEQVNSQSGQSNQQAQTKEAKKELIKTKDAAERTDEDDYEMVDIESEPTTVNKTCSPDNEKSSDYEMIEIEKVNNNNENSETADSDKSRDCLEKPINAEKQNEKLLIGLDLIKKMMTDCTYTSTKHNTARKQKFDVDSLLDNEQNKCM